MEDKKDLYIQQPNDFAVQMQAGKKWQKSDFNFSWCRMQYKSKWISFDSVFIQCLWFVLTVSKWKQKKTENASNVNAIKWKLTDSTNFSINKCMFIFIVNGNSNKKKWRTTIWEFKRFFHSDWRMLYIVKKLLCSSFLFCHR